MTNKEKKKRTRHKRKIRALIDKVKDVPCADCGEKFSVRQMTFDHLPEKGKKLFKLADGLRKGVKAVLAEIAKCAIVCRTCHDKREYARGVFGPKSPKK